MTIKSFIKKNRYTLLVAFLILSLAFLLRVLNLANLPVFADEGIYVRWAQVMRAEPTLRFLPLSDGKQPLFMWSVIPFFKLFQDPLFAGRFVSVIAGLGTTVGIFLSSFLLFKSEKISLIAALIYAISPFGVFFDRMALADSMLAMFGVWVFVGGILLARTLRADVAMLTGYFLGGALLTKSPALFFVLLLPLTLLSSKFPKAKSKRISYIVKVIVLFALVLIIGYGIYNVLRLGPNFHLVSQRNLDYVHPYSHILESPLEPFWSHFKAIFEFFWTLGPSVVYALFLLGVFSNWKKNWKELLLLSAWGLVPIFIVAEYSKAMTARYILFSLPYLAIIAASGFVSKKDSIKKLFTLVFIIFIFQSLLIDKNLLFDPESANLPRSERSGYLEEWTAGTGIKEVAEQIKVIRDQHKEKEIIVGTEGYFGTLPDGLQIYLNQEPRIRVIGVGLALDSVPDPLVESKAAGNMTYLVVNNERLHAKYEDLGMKLVAVYPKAIRPDGSRQALYFLEVTNEAVSIKTQNN